MHHCAGALFRVPFLRFPRACAFRRRHSGMSRLSSPGRQSSAVRVWPWCLSETVKSVSRRAAGLSPWSPVAASQRPHPWQGQPCLQDQSASGTVPQVPCFRGVFSFITNVPDDPLDSAGRRWRRLFPPASGWSHMQPRSALLLLLWPPSASFPVNKAKAIVMSLLDKDVPNFRVIIISGQRVRDIKGERDLNIPVTFYWTIIQNITGVNMQSLCLIMANVT